MPKTRKPGKTTLSQGRYVNLILIGNNLEITPTEKGINHAIELRETGQSGDVELWEMLEDHLQNGWEFISPKEIGALTDGPIISNEILRNDHGELVIVGRVFWHSNYVIENPIDTFAEGKIVTFEMVGKSLPNTVYREFDQLQSLENRSQRVDWKSFTKKWTKKLDL